MSLLRFKRFFLKLQMQILVIWQKMKVFFKCLEKKKEIISFCNIYIFLFPMSFDSFDCFFFYSHSWSSFFGISEQFGYLNKITGGL